jgi:hypothetical protein
MKPYSSSCPSCASWFKCIPSQQTASVLSVVPIEKNRNKNADLYTDCCIIRASQPDNRWYHQVLEESPGSIGQSAR